MRPGQEAPDGHTPPDEIGEAFEASMRPGQEAPDGEFVGDISRFVLADASMRPGQEAPDGFGHAKAIDVPNTGFNEAGARSPGWAGFCIDLRTIFKCFNEAGARSPGWETTRTRLVACDMGFNEAGARSPGWGWCPRRNTTYIY